jgi:hypothetical protein
MKAQNTPAMGDRKSRPVAGEYLNTTEPEHNVVGHPQSSGEDRHARVAVRAYELYVERGRRDGKALDDWLDAEFEMLGKDLADSSYLENSPHLR